MKKCMWCGIESNGSIECLMEHFAFYKSGYWKYLKGNIKMKGSILGGFMSTVYLAFPFICSIVFYRYRKSHLIIPDVNKAEND